MSDKDTKVLGYVAIYRDKLNVICDGNSCIVAGSADLMRQYIVNWTSGESLKDYDVTKARYGQIRQALMLGAAYSFDQQAFERFRPLATLDGYDLSHISTDISAWPKNGRGIPLTRIEWVASSTSPLSRWFSGFSGLFR